jgi:hypothetical protein
MVPLTLLGCGYFFIIFQSVFFGFWSASMCTVRPCVRKEKLNVNGIPDGRRSGRSSAQTHTHKIIHERWSDEGGRQRHTQHKQH